MPQKNNILCRWFFAKSPIPQKDDKCLFNSMIIVVSLALVSTQSVPCNKATLETSAQQSLAVFCSNAHHKDGWGKVLTASLNVFVCLLQVAMA